MSFQKYESIDNYTNKKEIEYHLAKRPEYLTEKFIVQHKYDGANFQIIFQKNTKEFKFGSRNLLLEQGDNFFNYKEIIKMPEYVEMLQNVQKYLDSSESLNEINLFGEIYGNGVQNRIKYFSEDPNSKCNKKMVFFDVYFNGELQTQKNFIKWAAEMKIPVVDTYLIDSFDECIKFDPAKIRVELNGEKGDQIEGVVVKPYETEPAHRFYIKIKNVGFEEIRPNKEKKQPKKDDTTESVQNKLGINLNDKSYEYLVNFEKYLEINRVRNMFGKQSWKRRDMPKLAEAILNDAKTDFDIDYPDVKVDMNLVKKFYNKNVFALIKQEDKMFND